MNAMSASLQRGVPERPVRAYRVTHMMCETQVFSGAEDAVQVMV